MRGKNKCKANIFNLESLVDRLGGDYELLNDIIEEVVSSKYEKEFFEGIESYFKDKDVKKLSMHIHKFKGSISHFQAASIDEVLREIKEKCNNQDFFAIEKLYWKLKLEYKHLKECLVLCKIRKE